MSAPSARVYLRCSLEGNKDLPTVPRLVLWVHHSLCDVHGGVQEERLRAASGLDSNTWQMAIGWLMSHGWLHRVGKSDPWMFA